MKFSEKYEHWGWPWEFPYNVYIKRMDMSYLGDGKMTYRVHRIETNSKNIQERLEQFLNNLDGEVVAVLPNIIPTFKPMGATSKVDSLIIVEKI